MGVGSELISGSVTGLVVDMLLHPIDTVRTKVMMSGRPSRIEIGTIWRSSGFLGFFRGSGMVLAGTIPAHAFYFGGYEWGKRQLLGSDDGGPAVSLQLNENVAYFSAGVIAELCGALIWTPMDIIKQRVQHQSAQGYTNSWQACGTLWREEGFRGFFRGLTVGVATYAPYIGLYFMIYERGKQSLARRWHGGATSRLSALSLLSLGAFAGSVSAVVTTPLDVLKTRCQTKLKSPGALHELKLLLRHEGVLALFHGTTVRVIHRAPGAALTIAGYDKMKIILDQYMK